MAFSWQQFKKPIFVLAPMEEVTDVAFREMFARYSTEGFRDKVQASRTNNFVMFTEFVSVDGLMHEEGRKRLSLDLQYTENQRPIIAQIWGSDPEKFTPVAEYVASLGFDGIDINMGCPQQKEIAAGACAALIRDPELAVKIIKATMKGAGKLPVSVKTRLGYTKADEMENWAKTLLNTGIANLTMHARTKKEMSKVPAHWEKITELVEIRNRENPGVTVIGNGDIQSYEEGLSRITQTGCDGVMVGRGAFGNPWFFRTFEGTSFGVIARNASDEAILSQKKIATAPVKAPVPRDDTQLIAPAASGGAASFLQGFVSPDVKSMTGNHSKIAPEERLRVMIEHAELFEKYFSGIKSFFIMRKHFKAYCSGFPGASDLRVKLMEAKNLEETKQVVKEYLELKEIARKV